MRWKHLSALALPFVIGAWLLRLAVAPAGDAIAGSVALAAAASPPPQRSPASLVVPSTVTSEPAAALPAVVARTAPSSPAARPASVDAGGEAGREGGAEARAPSPSLLSQTPKAMLVVSAASVTRALARRDVGATNAMTSEGAALGARLAGVSRYGAGLRDGDVVVSIGGVRTPNVAALVSAGMAAAGGGATRIAGRIVRGDALYAVVVELPK
jgi:hypothetical protein